MDWTLFEITNDLLRSNQQEPRKQMSMGDVLGQSGLASPDQIEQALQYSKEKGLRIGEALVELGITDQDQINWAMAKHLGIPYVEISYDILDKDLITRFPAQLLLKHRMLPLVATEYEISVALADPTELEGVAQLEKLDARRVALAIAGELEIVEMLHRVFAIPISKGESVKTAMHYGSLLELIKACTNRCLFGLYIDPTENGFALKGKGDGGLYQIKEVSQESIENILQEVQDFFSFQFNGLPQAVNRNLILDDQKIDLSITVFPTSLGDSVYIDINSPKMQVNLEHSNLTYKHIKELKELLKNRQGFFGVTSADERLRRQVIFALTSWVDQQPGKTVYLKSDLFNRQTLFKQADSQTKVQTATDQIVWALQQYPDALILDEIDIFNQGFLNNLFQTALSTKIVGALGFESCEDLIKFFQDNKISSHLLHCTIQAILACKNRPIVCEKCTEKSSSINLFAQIKCSNCMDTGFSGRKIIIDFLPFTGKIKGVLLEPVSLDFLKQIRSALGYLPLEDRLEE